MNFRTVADMDRAIAANLWKLSRFKFDVIVGIPRSGMIPASILATYLQLPLATLEGYCAGIIHGRSGKPVQGLSRILLVDDTSNKGGAMQRAVGMLGPKRPKSITRLAVYGPYQVEDPAQIIDVWFEDCRGPRAFSWNMAKHARLRRWGFDFDGVLCRDPTSAENDDGPRYLEFMRGAEPLFMPTRPIGHIVTGRLEKYRPQCEDWLGRHGIEYAQLHMMPFASKAERMAHGGRGQWKAGIAREVGVEMFVESCPKQARIIAERAQIPVFCTGTQSLA
jgi:orotate phosphoribosyltransferase